MSREPKAMREIHKIREQLHEIWKNMTKREVLRDIHQGSKAIREKYGLKIQK